MSSTLPKIKSVYYWSAVTQGEAEKNEAAFGVKFKQWDGTTADMHRLANIFKAAPDLLEALKAMVLNDAHDYRDCHKQALAAIAKATGAAQ